MKNLLALAVALLVTANVGCGKKSSGGGGTESTPADPQNVSETSAQDPAATTAADGTIIPVPTDAANIKPDAEGTKSFYIESSLPSLTGNGETAENANVVRVVGLKNSNLKDFTSEDFLKVVQGLCDKTATTISSVVPDAGGVTTVKWSAAGGGAGNFSLLIAQSMKDGANSAFCTAD